MASRDIPRPDSPGADPSLLNHLAWSQRWRDRRVSRARAEQAFAHASDVTVANTNRKEAALAMRTLAWQAKWRGALDLAREFAGRALPDLQHHGASSAMADCLCILATVQYSRGQPYQAMDTLARAHKVLDLDSNVGTRLDILVNEATALRYLGRSERAGAKLNEATELASEAELAWVRYNTARHFLDMVDQEGALAEALPSVLLCRRWHNNVVYPYALEILGACYQRTGRADRAEECFEEGLEVARRDGDVRVQCEILRNAGALALSLGDAATAISLLTEGRRLAAKIGYLLWEQNFCRELAEAHESRGDYAAALAAMKDLDRLVSGVRG